MGTRDNKVKILSDEQKKLLLRSMLQSKRNHDKPRIKKVKDKNILSFAQQRMWLLHQLDPSGSQYNMYDAFVVQGPLDYKTLLKSINAIVKKHKILRTVYKYIKEDGSVQPIVLPFKEQNIKLVEKENDQGIESFITNEVDKPFDLERGPLFEVTLIRKHVKYHVLLIRMHHILADGWSFTILRKELKGMYQAYHTLEEVQEDSLSIFQEPTIQYNDFAYWQKDLFDKGGYEKQVQYWQNQLQNIKSLEIPTDFQRPKVLSNKGARYQSELDENLSERIEQFCLKHNCTLYMFMLAVYSTLLFRYTGQDDFGIGSPIANRNSKELEDIIGFFVNTLVIRSQLSENETFNESLEKITNTTLEAFRNQDVPFEKIVEIVNPERKVSHNPLVQVAYVHHNTPSEKLIISDLTIEEYYVKQTTSKFDLLMITWKKDGILNIAFDYSTELYAKKTVRSIVDQLIHIIDQVLEDINLPISQIELLNSGKSNMPALASGVTNRNLGYEEREIDDDLFSYPEEELQKSSLQVGEIESLTEKECHIQLEKWNNTQTEYPRQKSVDQLFEEQTTQTPSHIALEEKGQTLTYQEVNEHSNQLARYLLDQGIKPGDQIGIWMNSSISMVISMLGILKVGGIYIPLDRSLPEERVKNMVEGIHTVLTTRKMAKNAPSVFSKLIYLDEAQEEISKYSHQNILSEETGRDNERAEEPAYIMFTSGSTGKPKGVVIPHRGIVRLVKNVDYVQLDSEQTILQIAPVSFDASTFEIWGALLNGGKLVLMPIEKPSLSELGEWIRNSKATTVWLTAGLFHQLVDRHLEDLQGLKQLLAGGDVLSVQHCNKVRQTFPECRLINGYGPTENTTFTCTFTLTDYEYKNTIPIGKPINNTQVYLLNQEFQPVPVGTVGELFIGGDGLAKGYLNQEEQTRSRFIQHPWKKGERLYRTGDLARYRGDGTIEFIGRKDFQVKIRGYRIELEEIERIIQELRGIEDAVVHCWGEREEKQLVAYVVGGLEEGWIQRIRTSLEKRLPSYMVPNRFIQMEQLPLTLNGKVDRKALPEPSMDRPELVNYVAPSTDLEIRMAKIWSDILGIERVGIHDNFFDLGGHSLIATQIVAHIFNHFQIELPLREIFEYQTIYELVGRIQHKERLEIKKITPMPVRGQEQDIPLSFAQQRMWLLHRLDPDSVAYHICGAIQLNGALDREALKKGLHSIVERHSVLRTRFMYSNEKGMPVQVIDSINGFTVNALELEEEEVQAFISEEMNRPFNLEEGPLFEPTLIKLSDKKHILFLRMHHIVSDGWSMGLFRKEFKKLYEGYVQETSPTLSPLPIQYSDFSYWQRNLYEKGELEDQINYWKEKLRDVTPLNFLTDYPRPSRPTFTGKIEQFQLTAKETKQIKEWCQQHNGTFYMYMLTIIKVLLYRYTQQEDLCIGTPIANRNQAEIENLIGFFVNTLVLRTKVTGEYTYQELFEHIKESTLEAYSNQDIPFEKVVELVNPERDLTNTNPLFQVAYSHQNMSSEALEFEGLTVEEYQLEHTISKFDLMFLTSEIDGQFHVNVEYSTDLFKETTIQQLMGHLHKILKEVLRNPEVQVGKIDLLTEKERQLQLEEWNNTQTEYPRQKSVDQLFEEQATQTPSHIALEEKGQTLTYQEVNERSNQLARYLLDQGIKPGDQIGIWMNSSIPMVISMLGILKVGGIYIPLDRSLPEERVKNMVEGIHTVLTTRKMAKNAPSVFSKLIYLDEAQEEISKFSHQNILSEETGRDNERAEEPAYIMFTSGSTGKPKGVVIPHRGIVRLVKNVDYVQLDSEQTILQIAPVSFDAATFEIWGALLNGGKLVLMPIEKPSLSELGEWIRNSKATTVWLTAGLFHQLVDRHLEDLQGLKQLLAGGDVLSVQHCNKVRQTFPECRLINGYGPTENTTFTCTFTLTDYEYKNTIPVGKPINNTQVYLLDQEFQPVPVGTAGELFIGGDGLAKGYLNQEEQTRSRFIQHPWKKGERLYRTGDLARYRGDGTIEFIGRKDFQVKIRGYRIELEEIERIIQELRGIEDAVVHCWGEREEKQLVAYVVGGLEEGWIQRIRTSLEKRLPSYMVPNRFIQMEQLPLTLNGKVDRKALPEPSMDRPELANYVAPSTDIEIRMAEIWSDILGIERVGIHDNFFDLGGHSLIATRIVAHIFNEFQIELPLREIFECQTIYELVGRIQQMEPQEVKIITPMPVRGQEQDIPLSFAQQRMWLLHRLEPDSVAYHICGAIQLIGALDREALKKGLHSIVERHSVLRTRFMYSNEKGMPVQVIDSINGFTVSSLELDEEEVQAFISEEMNRPFNLEEGPLFEPTLIKLSDTKHILFLRMHHIVSDGWSMGLFRKEIKKLYEGYVQETSPTLSPLPIQYSDFSYWQRSQYEKGELEDQINYWKEKLRDVTPLNFPTDYPRPSRPTFTGKIEQFQLTAKETKQIKEWCQQHNGTFYMYMLSILKVLLYRYTQQEDLCIGTPIANRNQAEIEDLIGFFVNTLVLRTKVTGEYTYQELFEHIKESTLEAYSNQDIPFEKVVELVNPERDLTNTNPLFQVAYSHQNMSSEALEFEGLMVEEYQLEHTISKFDLMFLTSEIDGQFHVNVEYSTDLFKETTIQQLMGHLHKILKEVLRNPEVQVGKIDLLSEKERQLQLEVWNNTQTKYPNQKSIDQLFEEQVVKTPDATAVVFEDQSITYRALNQRANQLARLIRKKGVQADDLVGIMAERSIEMVVGILAILKSGGAYVPIDPIYPIDRIQYMLEDSGVKLVLTQQLLTEQLESYQGDIVFLDDQENYQGDTENLVTISTPNSLAYIIYTSGTTGMPKGVMIEHRNVVRLLFNDKTPFDFNQTDVWTMFHSFCFDFSVWEMYGALLYGGKLIVISKEIAQNPKAYLNLLKEERVTILNQTPTAFYQLIEEDLKSQEKDLSIRKVIFGGEALAPRLIGKWQEKYEEIDLINMYGITETTVHVTYRLLTKEDIENNSRTIGSAIPTLIVYLLDNDGNLVPVGVPGEIYVSGAGVARGYLNKSDLTAERFLENPFIPGERMYKTGDLGRWLPDGTMEYLGRIDDQVKIRGYRIELGEVESHLLKLESIQEAIVLVREDKNIDKYLCAYIVSEREVNGSEIRQNLAKNLPGYMIPAKIVQLEKMPLTLNGKVDRKSLPEPSMDRPELDNYVAPSTNLEIQMAEIWTDILGIERVGIHDNFFELGGHSLLATQIVAHILNEFHVELPLREIFEKPTIHELVNFIENEKITQDGKNQAMNLEDILNEIQNLSDEEVKNRLKAKI